MDLDKARELIAYTAWADAAVWAAVLGNATAAADERVRGYLAHAGQVQRLFLALWRGEPRPTPDEVAETAALLAGSRRALEEAAAHLGGLDASELARETTLPIAGRVAGGEPAASTLADTVFQVVNHSTYHRGQVTARLRELGGEPPLVDYIAWVWRGRPEAAWPEAGS